MDHPRIAVVIPCLNEELTIRKVIRDFREALPEADIWVFDNSSTDATAQVATDEGARVRHVRLRGKGSVVRTIFRDVDADILLMVDGDDTYPAGSASVLLNEVASGGADMAVGARLEQHATASFRPFHGVGNRLVRWTISRLFGHVIQDPLSGYRAISMRFARSMPVLSMGFEIETEMTVFGLMNGLTVSELQIQYGERPAGSESKLHTFRDGFRVLRTILFLFKDLRPLLFFGLLSAGATIAGLTLGGLVLAEFLNTGAVTHPSSAVLAAAMILAAMMSIATGLILDTGNRRSNEILRLLTDQVVDRRTRT